MEKGLVPDNYHDELIRKGREWSCYSKEDTYEAVLYEPLDDLLRWGARKIDCDLCMAVAKLDYDTARTLLQQGVNPYTKINIDDPSQCEHPETTSSIIEVEMWWLDAYEACAMLEVTWKYGYNKIDATISDSDFIQLLISAPYKLMYDLLISYSADKD